MRERETRPDGVGWFPVDVTMRDRTTGETRTYLTWSTEREDEPWSEFIWSEGNYACDCNRALFFERASGNEIDDAPCGADRYQIVNLSDARNGGVLYCEPAEEVKTGGLSG